MSETRSFSYAKEVEALSTIALPDKWFDLPTSTSLYERFEYVVMSELGTENPSELLVTQRVNALVEKYKNEGRAFKYIIYFNRPMSIDDNEAAYILYVVSIAKNIFVTVSGVDHKAVLNNEKRYNAEQLLLLEQVFGKKN